MRDSAGNQRDDAVPGAVVRRARIDRRGGARAVRGRSRAARCGPRRSPRSAFAAALQTGGLPQLDLLVRTSGEERLSNFLLWEAAYAELYFTDTFWPAFGKPRALRGAGVVSAAASAASAARASRSAAPARRAARGARHVQPRASALISAVVALPLVGALILWQRAAGVRRRWCWWSRRLALHEYGSHRARRRAARGCASASSCWASALAAALYVAARLAVVWVLAAFVATAALVLFDPGDIPAAGARLGIAAFGVFYLGLLCAPLAILQRDAPHGRGLGDARDRGDLRQRHGRLLRGPGLGRHKLYPAVSPAQDRRGRGRRPAGRPARHAGGARARSSPG